LKAEGTERCGVQLLSLPPINTNMRLYELLHEQRVLSSWIGSLDYVDINVIMILKNGHKYTIHKVLPGIYDKWMAASSKGRFWHANIVGKYQVSRNI